MAQVFEGVAGNHVAGVAVDIAVGVVAACGGVQWEVGLIAEGEVDPGGTYGGMVHGVPSIFIGVAHPVDDLPAVAVVECGLDGERTGIVSQGQFGGKTMFAVKVGIGDLVDALVVEVGEGGQAIGAAKGGEEVQFGSETVVGGSRETVVEAEGGVVKAEDGGLGSETVAHKAVAGEEGSGEPRGGACVGRSKVVVVGAEDVAPDAFASGFDANKCFAYADFF